MAVQSINNELTAQFNLYKTELARFMGNGRMLSQEGKLAAANALRGQMIPTIRGILFRLWGDIIDDGSGGTILDPMGMVWIEQRLTEQRLNDAKNAAERAGVDPAYIMLARDRAAGMVRTAQTPASLKKQYDESSRDIKIVLQESIKVLLPADRLHNSDWHAVVYHIENDRRQRLNTPEVQQATAAATQWMDETIAAWETTKLVADDLGLYDGYIQRLLTYIVLRRQPMFDIPEYPHGVIVNTIDRQRYGVTPMGDKGFQITSPTGFLSGN